MKRRAFVMAAAAAGSTAWLPGAAWAAASRRAAGFDNLLILIELNGGNDGLNTVVPYSDPLYYRYRPRLAVPRDAALAIDERTALHPSLAPLMPLWHARQLAIVQGVGYAPPNLSHFRSTEIWETASRADQYLEDGWLTRAFAQRRARAGGEVGRVVLGSPEDGPFASRARVGARVAEHVWPQDLHSPLKTTFPAGPFGASIETAMKVLASNDSARTTRVAAIRITLHGFDTHENQAVRHAALLAQFAAGLGALRDALVELGRWDRTLIVTYSEFGRSARENSTLGTDHGTASAHFIAGGRVRGGLYGAAPPLARIDASGRLPVAVDFRRIYATVLRGWWGIDARAVLQQRFEPLPLLRI